MFDVNIGVQRCGALWYIYLAEDHFRVVFAKVRKCATSALHLAYLRNGTALDTSANACMPDVVVCKWDKWIEPVFPQNTTPTEKGLPEVFRHQPVGRN